MLKPDLKYCEACKRVFEASLTGDKQLDELACPYLDCGGEGTIVEASLMQRVKALQGSWRDPYLRLRGRVKLTVKAPYVKALRTRTKLMNWYRGMRESDDPLDSMSEEEIEAVKQELREDE